jgi:hypothetical protein
MQLFTGKGVVVLQDSTDTQRVTLGSYNEIYVSSYDGNWAVDMKVEELSDVEAEGEEDPLLITSPAVTVEKEVSYKCVCKFHKYAGLCLICIIFISGLH